MTRVFFTTRPDERQATSAVGHHLPLRLLMNRRGELLKTNRNMSGQNLTEEEGRWVDVFVGLIIGGGGGVVNRSDPAAV